LKFIRCRKKSFLQTLCWLCFSTSATNVWKGWMSLQLPWMEWVKLC